MTQPLQANLKGWPFAAAQAVIDPNLEELIQFYSAKVMINDCMNDDTVVPKFYEIYRNWITSSQANKVKGLDAFPIVAYSQGTTESFDKFYLKNNKRRFRCFRGEYMYHRVSWRNYFPDYKYVDDTPGVTEVETGDAVVVSWPFADTGERHPLLTTEFLDDCHAKGVPVLVDAAFFGLCGGMEFDFDHPAITDITFSLSKSFPVNYLRIGIRFTREDDDDSLLVLHKTQYVNRFGAAVGTELMNRFTADYNFETWRELQLKWCMQMGLVPSNSVIFGIDHNHKYDHYNRGMADTNRLCFAKYYDSGILPKDIKSN